MVLCVTIEDVDELLLLDGTNHHGASLRIHSQILSRHDAPASGLAESLELHLHELVLGLVVLDDENATRVRADDCVI